jgi:hypothetical protein
MTFFSVSLDYHSAGEGGVLLDIAVENEPFLFGLWTYTIQLGTKTLRPVGNWTEVSDVQENQCDYRKIELPLENHYRLQRSVLLDHQDKVMLLGDAVVQDAAYTTGVAAKRTSLAYRSSLNCSKKRKYKVLPESVVQEKSLASIGYQIQTAGTALFAPLFFDLDAQRLSKKRLWQPLTVGENLQRVPDDRAVGYRVQLGKEQFLIYRSLTPLANRTVLGHNLIDEFCFARFEPETGTEALVSE